MAPSQHDDPHLTPEELTQSAAGEPDRAPQAAHLVDCASCRHEVTAYRRVVAALSAPVDIAEVPAGLWRRIEASLGHEGAAAEVDGAEARGTRATSSVVPLRPRADARGRRPARGHRGPWLWVAAAAVAGILVGAGAYAVLNTLLDRAEAPAPPAPAPVAVGSAELVPFTTDGVQGQAEMTQDPDGHLELTVKLTAVPSDGFREVWLRDEDGTRLLSLGAMSTDTASMAVPDGVDLDEFPVVDVSQEEFDGNPAHSGVTLAAGPMTGE